MVAWWGTAESCCRWHSGTFWWHSRTFWWHSRTLLPVPCRSAALLHPPQQQKAMASPLSSPVFEQATWSNSQITSFSPLLHLLHGASFLVLQATVCALPACYAGWIGLGAQVLQQSTFHNHHGELCIKLGDASALYNPRCVPTAKCRGRCACPQPKYSARCTPTAWMHEARGGYLGCRSEHMDIE